MMLTDMLQAHIKAATTKFLTDTCTIRQQTVSHGEYGESIEQFSIVATDVACRVITVGNRFRETTDNVAARETVLDIYRLVCPAGTALAAGQQITTSDGTVWQVVDLVTDRTDGTDSQAIIMAVSDE